MLGGEPGAFPALEEPLTDPDLGEFGFAKATTASQYLVAMRLQGPVGFDLSGMHLSRRDHGLRVIFPRELVTHDDIEALFSFSGREIRLQTELQPDAGLIHPVEVSEGRELGRKDQSSPSQVPKSQLGRFRCLACARGSFPRPSVLGNRVPSPLR
jgi:hypothetical protein